MRRSAARRQDDRRRQPQCRQAPRDRRPDGAVRARGDVGDGELGLPEPDETGTTFEENAASRRSPRPAPPACRRSPTIPACASTRSTARPASTPPTGRRRPTARATSAMAMQQRRGGAAGGRRVDAGAAHGPLRRGALPRLARRRRGIFPRRGRGHAGLAAARRQRASATIRCSCRTGYDTHLRRDDGRGEARLEAWPGRRRCRTARAPSRSSPAAEAGIGMTLRERDPGFGVYVHWPFCAAKCPYCDFNSHVRHQPVDQARFATAFATRDWRRCARAPARATVTSIFLGGGTPSLMEPETVGAVLDADRAATGRCPTASRSRWRPTRPRVEAERFRGYRAAGVNRVSLGVQALNDADLRFLGRLHDVDGGAEGDRAGARDLSAPVLRPDLCPARPDAGGLGGRARTRRSATPPTICRSTS